MRERTSVHTHTHPFLPLSSGSKSCGNLMESSTGVMQFSVRLLLCLLTTASCCNWATSYSPSMVKIGALLHINSTIGKVAMQAMQMAIQNVNNDPALLKGMQLELEIADSECDPVEGAASAMELVEKGVVAIVGPQSSAVSQFVAHIGRATLVPIVSFGATDPRMSEQQYSYFFRTVPSDAMQMKAIAALIAYYGWNDVAMIYTDDDYGANGAATLRQLLHNRGSRIIKSLIIIPGSTNITDICIELKNITSRVYVLHTPRELGFKVLADASSLGMVAWGYVWIVTDLVANGLFSPDLDPMVVDSLQGLLGIHRYVPPSPEVYNLLSQWREKDPADMESLNLSHLNAYGLYAYDAIYIIAQAISVHLAQGHNLTFTEFYDLHTNFVGERDYQHMKVLQSGAVLRENLQKTNFSGTSGHIQFDKMGDVKDVTFEYINMVGKNPVVAAYWTSENPQLVSTDATHRKLANLTLLWPGNTHDIPQGWIPPRNGALLKIGVPIKKDYPEFVSQVNIFNITTFGGFCIDVFEKAVHNLNYTVSFLYIPVSNNVSGKVNPNYDDLISGVAKEELDAAVGDITITADRLMHVDFTQPFIKSGLVVLVRRNNKKNNQWAFLQPFTASMWVAILGFTLFTGLMILILEHRINEDFQGSARQQFGVVLWFIFSTFFQTQREGTRSFFGRVILILWLFVVLVLTSSYSASLTAFLTVQQLTPDVQTFDSIIRSNDSIGYQTGSFVKRYLTDEFNINPDRLRDMNSQTMYIDALDRGPNDPQGVVAVVDELLYVESFLRNHCDNYAKASQVFKTGGWGFVFPKGSQMAEDLSREILRLSESGELVTLHDHYFKSSICDVNGMSLTGKVNQLGIDSFWVLFLIMGATSLVCGLIHLIRMAMQNLHEHGQIIPPQNRHSSQRNGWIRQFNSRRER